MSKVMVVAPHPDDETLGCGGTLLKFAQEGYSLFWLIVTEGNKEFGWSEDRIKKRKEEINLVQEKYGFEERFQLGFTTTRLDEYSMNEIISRISSAINKVKPEIILSPDSEDVHTDHKITFQALISSTKNFRKPYIKKIMSYECLSETEYSIDNNQSFSPNAYMDVSQFMQKKLDIMKTYESEVMDSPGPRSPEVIKALGRYRGSRINTDFAEAFQVVHEAL